MNSSIWLSVIIIIVVVFVTYISRGAVGASDTSALTACRGTLQTVLATIASGCAAISCAVASDDTDQLVWCWRKVRHNRDEVLVLCHPPPICLLHIADTQPLMYLQVYSHAVVSRSVLQRSGAQSDDLVSSYFVAKLCIPLTINIVSFLPSIQTHWCRFSCVYDVVNCCVLLEELFSIISEQRTWGESLQRQSFSETI